MQNSCGVPGRVWAAMVLSRAWMSADFTPALIAALSLSTISGGVPAGAMTPHQESATKSVNPLSIMVGTSGRSGRRARMATPSGRMLPSRRWDSVIAALSKPRSIWPPIRSLNTAGAPL